MDAKVGTTFEKAWKWTNTDEILAETCSKQEEYHQLPFVEIIPPDHWTSQAKVDCCWQQRRELMDRRLLPYTILGHLGHHLAGTYGYWNVACGI